jgi:hypothetical protein
MFRLGKQGRKTLDYMESDGRKTKNVVIGRQSCRTTSSSCLSKLESELSTAASLFHALFGIISGHHRQPDDSHCAFDHSVLDTDYVCGPRELPL